MLCLDSLESLCTKWRQTFLGGELFLNLDHIFKYLSTFTSPSFAATNHCRNDWHSLVADCLNFFFHFEDSCNAFPRSWRLHIDYFQPFLHDENIVIISWWVDKLEWRRLLLFLSYKFISFLYFCYTVIYFKLNCDQQWIQ